MDLGKEALIKLEAHERECLVRYEAIQDTLTKHHERFDKLEVNTNDGFRRIERFLVWGVSMLATFFTILLGVAEYLR
jgi:hypothetical protein